MSENRAGRVRSAESTFEVERKSKLADAVLFAAAVAFGAAVLFGYEIVFFLAHGTHFSEALASAVQLSQGFYPPP